MASLILVVGALATLAMLDNGAQATTTSRQRDVANALVQEMVERATAGTNTTLRNDLVDVDPGASPTIAGPADRMRVALDPDGDQSSTAVTPASTVPSATAGPRTTPQTWTLKRQGTTYTVSYYACTASDVVQGVAIKGTFDCDWKAPTNPGDQQAIDSSCSLGLRAPTAAELADPGQLTVNLQLLGATGLSVCVGALSQPLSNALCTLLGTSPTLNSITNALLSSGGILTRVLGVLNSNAAAGLCSSTQVATDFRNAISGIGATTRVAITVGWKDAGGHQRAIQQRAVVRRATTS